MHLEGCLTSIEVKQEKQEIGSMSYYLGTKTQVYSGTIKHEYAVSPSGASERRFLCCTQIEGRRNHHIPGTIRYGTCLQYSSQNFPYLL